MVGSTNNGLSPGVSLSNPFPSGLRAPTGNAAGALTDVGFDASTGVPYSRHSTMVQQYSLGLQYAVATNDVVTPATSVTAARKC